MKKLLCLLLALMMLLALMAGCDSDSDRRRDDDDDDDGRPGYSAGDRKPGKKDDDDDDDIVADDDDDDEDAKDAPASATTEPPTAATEPPTEATEPPTESVEEASDLSLGYWEGSTYINEYAGFVCNLDASWQLYSAQDLQDLPEQIANAGSEELGAFLENYTQISAMMAENATDLVSMNLLYQKLTPAQMALYASLSEEETVDTTLKEVAMMEEYFNSLGITVHSQEKVKVIFMGEEHYALYSVMEIQGIPYYNLQLMDFTLGEYGVTLTLASYLEDNTQSMLELFEPLS